MRPFTFAEFDPTDGVTDPAGGVDPPTNPDPDPVPASESDPASAAAPDEWSGPSREEWEGLLYFAHNAAPVLQNLTSAIDQREQAPPDPDPEPNFDPFQPESVQQFVRSEIERGVRSQLEAYEPILNQVQAREGEQMARAELERLRPQVGAFDDDLALLVASGILQPGTDGREVVSQAARYVAEHEAKIRADEREKIAAEQRAIAERKGDLPAANGAATEALEVPKGPDRYREVVARWRSNQNPSQPVG